MKVLFDKAGNTFCGVNNYAKKVNEELSNDGYKNESNILNIHYPIQSLKFSLFIVLQTLIYKLFKKSNKVVLTLHEYKTSSTLRKLSAKFLLLASNVIIVSNEEEKKALNHIQKPVYIIPIFANIKCKAINPLVNCNKNRILFFGNFYPARKVDYIIQKFIEFDNDDYELFLCGSPNERHLDYYNLMLDLIKGHDNIVIKTKVSEEDICRIASESLSAISIYDDGLSSKRTSALMFFAMGLPLLSNNGINTEDIFVNDECFHEFNNFEESMLFLKSSDNYERISKNGKEIYESSFSEESVIEKYKKVFDDITIG